MRHTIAAGRLCVVTLAFCSWAVAQEQPNAASGPAQERAQRAAELRQRWIEAKTAAEHAPEVVALRKALETWGAQHNQATQRLNDAMKDDAATAGEVWEVERLLTSAECAAKLREHFETSEGLPEAWEKYYPILGQLRREHGSEQVVKQKLIEHVRATEAGYRAKYEAALKAHPLKQEVQKALERLSVIRGAMGATQCLIAVAQETDEVRRIQRELTAMERPGSARPSGSGVAVWTAHSAEKVFKDAAPVTSRPAVLELRAGRGEVEAGQIVIRSKEATRLDSASVSKLAAADGKPFEGAVELLQVVYVRWPKATKDYPDALPPLKTPLELKADECQPIWVSISVPAGTAPGEYRGEVSLKLAGQAAFGVPVKLTVWPLAVPRRPSMRTAFGLTDNSIAEQHQVKPGSPEHKALLAKYWEFLVVRRISPYSIPVDVFDPQVARYLGDERLSSFVIPYSEDEAQLRKTVEHLRAGGWLDKGYFYVVDEPVKKEQYERLWAVCRKIQRVDPKLKIVSPYFRDPDYLEGVTAQDMLAGYVNIWCPNSHYFRPGSLAVRQRIGEEAWWYVCCGPGEPYANLFVQMGGMSHRMLMWQQRLYDVQGLLYWSTTYWNAASTKDPWADIATIKDINPEIGGDGSLMYPGRQVGVDGPVSSIRLEVLRDGLEDYEYLAAYEAAVGREKTRELIGRVVTSMSDFARDPAAIEPLREQMAATLATRPAP